MDLDCMKYAELRRLAKEAGLKANMKADKLREAIKQHYQQQQQQQHGEQETGVNGDIAPHVEDSNLKKVDPQVPSTSLFVTKRRGKASKRKYSDEVDTESKQLETDEKDSDSHSGAQATSAKKRRVPSTQQPDTQPEKPDTHAVPLPATCDTAEEPKVMKAGRIPRHQALLNRTKPMLKPTTPNFKKLHEAHFNKMESIDSYVQRKTKQMDVFKNSVKELKLLSDKTISKPAEGNNQRKSSRASLFSPAPVDKKLPSARHSQLNKPAVKDSVPFRPSILSTRRINVRFSQVVQDKEQKKAMVKTPARMSPSSDLITPGQDAKGKGKPEIKASGLSSTRTPGSTFVFNGNTSISNTPGTNKKSTFDLKASLSRPLSYKPHKGKLKPFGPTQETSVTIPSNQKNYKQHKVQTREDRRTKQNEDRKQKKENMLGARRGLTMS